MTRGEYFATCLQMLSANHRLDDLAALLGGIGDADRVRSVVVRVVGARLDGKPMPEPESAVGVVVGRTTWLRTAGETVEEMLARVRLMSEPHRRNAIPTMTLAF